MPSTKKSDIFFILEKTAIFSKFMFFVDLQECFCWFIRMAKFFGRVKNYENQIF